MWLSNLEFIEWDLNYLLLLRKIKVSFIAEIVYYLNIVTVANQVLGIFIKVGPSFTILLRTS